MNETRYVMSEVMVENVEEVAVKKESPYKTDIFILKILAFVAMSIIFATLTGFSLNILFVIDFVFIFAACIYGRMIGHTSSRSNSFWFCPARNSSSNDYRFDYGTSYSGDGLASQSFYHGFPDPSFSSNMSSIPNFGSPGYDSLGNYTGSSTAIGGISN